MGAVIAGAVVAAGAAAGTSYLQGRAKKAALAEQSAAIRNLELIDVKSYRKRAFNSDRAEYLNRFKLFREGDPGLSAVRDQAVSNLMSSLENTDVDVQKITNLLVGRATEDDSRLKEIEGKLLERAGKKLDAGATLPPEFQAELIRSGLETAGATGVGANRQGPLAQLLGNKIGAEQLELERAREAEALALAGGAQALQTNRLNILRGIAPELQNLNIARGNQAAQAASLASAALPTSAGLGGAEILSLLESNRRQKNEQMLALANLRAQKHLVSGETAAGYLGAGTSALTGILGGMGGGSGGGGGFNIGSLFGGGGAPAYGSTYAGAGNVPYISTPTATPGGGASVPLSGLL